MGIKLVNIGFTSSDGMCPHNHSRTGIWEFHYFIEGRGVFDNAGKNGEACPGQIFLSGPEDVHMADKSPETARLLFYWLQYLPGDDLLQHEVTGVFGPASSLQIGKSRVTDFEDLRRRWNTSMPLLRRSAEAKLEYLLCDLCGNNDQKDATSPATARYVDEAIAMMFASIHEPLSLDEISMKLGIDKAYFSRIFKNEMGQSPMKYCLSLRLDAAKHHLLTGNSPLRVLAKDFGFHDEFHFSHQFKSYTGQSPQAWRSRWANQ